MSAVDELVAKVKRSARVSDVERAIRESFAPGGPMLAREQVVEMCERWQGELSLAKDLSQYHAGKCALAGHLRDAFRSGEEPR